MKSWLQVYPRVPREVGEALVAPKILSIDGGDAACHPCNVSKLWAAGFRKAHSTDGQGLLGVKTERLFEMPLGDFRKGSIRNSSTYSTAEGVSSHG